MNKERETLRQAIKLLRKADEVLSDYWFGSSDVGDGYMEDYNNEDIIDIDKKIRKFLEEKDIKER